MKVNFLLSDNCALNYNGRHIDLHNNFDFLSLEYNVQSFSLELRWRKASGSWVPEDELPYLTLVHKQVSYLSLLPRDSAMPPTEDFCLSEVTFFPSLHRDINDSIIVQNSPAAGDDILYMFQSGQAIRINCKEIELVTG